MPSLPELRVNPVLSRVVLHRIFVALYLSTSSDALVLMQMRSSRNEMPERRPTPIEKCDQRPGDQAYCIERMFLDVEFAIEPIETKIEATGEFEKKT